ncbi:MAG: N-carbamoyl-D-amino-acid hydrolase [Planctomycetaceae bacterium]|nr:N-carbamoyl-D-amino-acid hydrolase [Planctomycetaceae bacterium]
MTRILRIAAAQSGPVPKNETREETLSRLIRMLRKAADQKAELIVFTECALTPFFPHWWIEDEAELDAYYDSVVPGVSTQALFEEARKLGIGVHLGYAELCQNTDQKRRFNSSVLVNQEGETVGRFRKVHLPGHAEHRPDNPFQNLEKRYFEVGDLGFPTWNAFGGVVGMCICNDRRWSETYRVLALGGAELILLGYNTPDHIPEHPELDRLVDFQHQLCMQAGAYQNGCWVVAVGKAGLEEGVSQIGLTSIIAPSGEIVAQSKTRGDELVIHDCDLDATTVYKKAMFNFEANRSPEHYRAITEQRGVKTPESVQ